MLAIILGGSLSVHASARQEFNWAIFFLLKCVERGHGSRDFEA
jgi:hypothetical protein